MKKLLSLKQPIAWPTQKAIWIIIVLFVLLSSCNQREVAPPRQAPSETIQSEPTQSELVTLQQCSAEEIERLEKRIDDLLRNSTVGAGLQTAYDDGLTTEKSPNEHGFWVFEELQSDGTSYPSPDRRLHVEKWGESGDTCSATKCSITPDTSLFYHRFSSSGVDIDLFSKYNKEKYGRLDPLVAAGHNHPLSEGYVGPSTKDIENQIRRGYPL